MEPDPAKALKLATGLGNPDVAVAVLPTYTAMLALRAVAEAAGAVGAFWAPGTPGAPQPVDVA